MLSQQEVDQKSRCQRESMSRTCVSCPWTQHPCFYQKLYFLWFLLWWMSLVSLEPLKNWRGRNFNFLVLYQKSCVLFSLRISPSSSLCTCGGRDADIWWTDYLTRYLFTQEPDDMQTGKRWRRWKLRRHVSFLSLRRPHGFLFPSESKPPTTRDDMWVYSFISSLTDRNDKHK